jgi:hypothetical protein
MESLGGGEVAMMMEEVGCWVLAGTTSEESRLNALFPLMKGRWGIEIAELDS